MQTRRYIRFVFITLSFFIGAEKVTAQVILQDSLALVALYNAQPLMGDSTWFHGNVSTWTGIRLEGNRVTEFRLWGKKTGAQIPSEICGLDTLSLLSLAYNQFNGLVPACLVDMPALHDLNLSSNQLTGVEASADFTHMNNIQYIAIAYNHFTDIPDFVSIPSPSFSTLDVSYNYFNFDDLIPLVDKIDPEYYFYYPQNTGSSTTRAVHVGDTIDLPSALIESGGTGNSYSWHTIVLEDYYIYPITSSRFSNIDGPALHLKGALLSDNALYQCNVTNPGLPNLIWQTGYFELNVIDPRSPQTLTYTGDTIAYCADSLLVLTATTTSGHPVLFESLNSDIATVNPDNTLNIYQRGTVTIRCIAPQDTAFLADTLLVDITIASHLTLPVFQMGLQLPNGEGEDLKFTIEYFPELQYHWTLPNGDAYDSSNLTISPFTRSDIGIYAVKVIEGTCVHSSMAHHIYSFPYGKLKIYELITPNGDGDNETFYIENLDPSVRNEVTIFNAVHQIVYHQENYRNDWHGSDLPVGTYYYFVKYGEQNYKGSLYIRR